MLIKNGWDEEAAKKDFFKKANYMQVTFGFSIEEGEARYNDYMKNPTFMCGSCYDDVERKDGVVIMECGHALCEECFGYFLQEKFSKGADCVSTTCCDHTCGMIIPSDLFKRFLTP